MREAGLLTRGTVEQVTSHPADQGAFSLGHPLFYLELRYSETASVQLPANLFLKLGKSAKEYFFYTQIAPLLDNRHLVHSYQAAYSPPSDTTCLLLEDLSPTHTQSAWPLPPPYAQCRETVRVLAQAHARWWNHPRLAADLPQAMPPGRSWADRIALAIQKMPRFFDFLGDRLSTNRRDTFERLLRSLPWEAPPSNKTLLHGDMHFWNVFYPRDAARETLRLFDWNMWDTGRPTDDLAFLIAIHWYPERRGLLEQNLLEEYLRALVECDITGYNAAILRQDYRVSVARSLFIPIWQWQRGVHPVIWWSHLERGMLAFEDLGCRDLLV